jgi:O-antigen ligase
MRAVRALMVLWVFGLVLGLSPQTPDPAAPVKWLITSVLTLLITLLCVGSTLLKRVPRASADALLPYLLKQPLTWALGAYAAVFLLASLAAPWPSHALLRIAPWLGLVLFAFLVARACTTPAHTEMLLIAAVCAVVLSSLYGLVQHIGLDPFPWAFRDRYEYTGLPSTYAHPNFAGHALVPGIIMALAMAWPMDKRPRTYLRTALLLAAAGAMLWHLDRTGMRAGWLALGAAGAGLALVSIMAWRLPRQRLSITVLGSAAALALVAALSLPLLLPRMAGPLNIDSSWILRLNGYLGAAEMIFQSPRAALLGIGPGEYAAQNTPYWTPFESRWYALYGMRNDHVHNELLEAAVEAGLPGLAATLFLLIAGAWTALELISHGAPRERRIGFLAVAALVAFSVDAQFGFNLHTPVSSGLFFMVLGICLAARRWSSETTPLPPNRARSFLAGAAASMLAAALCALASANYYLERRTLLAQGALEWAASEARDAVTANAALRWGADSLAHLAEWPIAHARHWRLLAQLRARLDMRGPATEAWREALRREPLNPAIASAAAAYLAEDDATLDEAAAIARQLAAICPHLAATQHVLLKAAMKGGDAEGMLQHAGLMHASVEPLAGEYWVTLGAVHTAAGDIPARNEGLARAVAMEPWREDWWQRLNETAIDEAQLQPLKDAYSNARLSPVPPPWLPELALRIAALSEDPEAWIVDALAHAPSRMALWGALASDGHNGYRVGAIVLAREAMGDCAENSTLAMLDALAQSLERRDAAATMTALEKIAMAMPALAYQEGDLWHEWGWLARMAEEAVRGWGGAGAPLWLRIATLYDATGDNAAAALLAAAIQPHLQGAELGAALLYQSKRLRNMDNLDQALPLARQAIALAPGSLYVRWHLARCLRDAGHLAEADFEYMNLVGRLPGNAPELPQLEQEYQRLQEALP